MAETFEAYRTRVLSYLGRVPHSFAVFANEWARRTALVIKSHHRTAFNFERPLLIIHSHCSNFTVKVRAKTAPPPLFRSFHQSALYRIPAHVTQLLDVFALAPHVEIVETLLPDPFRVRIPERHLRRCRPPPRLVEAPRKALLNHLHHH